LCKESVDKALFYLRCLELNGKGLVYIPYGGDWADEYINHGYVLFDQILHYFALDGYARISDDKKIAGQRDMLKQIIYTNYLPKQEHKGSEYVCNERLFKESLSEYRPPFPIPYFSSHSVHYHVDNFANALLLISDISSVDEDEMLRKVIVDMFLSDDFKILPAFHPVIEEGDEKWERLQKAYVFEFRNKPYRYHNGGLWPLVTGFFIASFGEKGGNLLEQFGRVLKDGGFVFHEYYHGKTHEPFGVTSLGFSASSYIIAHKAVWDGEKVFQ